MKTFSLTTLLFSCFFLFAQNGYHVRFKIGGYSYPHALIAYYFGEKQFVVDTVHRDETGYYTLKGDTIMRGGLYIFAMVKEIKDPKKPEKLSFEALNYFEFLLDSKDNQVFTLETDSANLVENMKVTGSLQNEIFYGDIRFIAKQRQKAEALQAEIKELKDAEKLAQKKELNDAEKLAQKKVKEAEMKILDDEVKTARKKIIDAHPTMLYTAMLKASTEIEIPEPPKDLNRKSCETPIQYYYFKAHYFGNIDLTDERLLRTPILEGKIMYYLDKMTVQMPDSLIKECNMLFAAAKPNKEMLKYLVVTLLNKYANSKIMRHDGVYAYISTTYYCSPAPNIKPIAAEWTDSVTCEKICERGKRILYSRNNCHVYAPPISIQDIHDTLQNLYDTKGDYIILYFWDYADEKSQKTTAQLVEIAKAYSTAKKKVVFYTVEANGTSGIWKEKVKEYGLDLPNIINTADPLRSSKFDLKYDMLSLPRILVLNKDKRIIAKHITTSLLDELLYHYIYEKEGSLLNFAAEKEDESK